MRNMEVPIVRLACAVARRLAHFTEPMYEIKTTGRLERGEYVDKPMERKVDTDATHSSTIDGQSSV